MGDPGWGVACSAFEAQRARLMLNVGGGLLYRRGSCLRGNWAIRRADVASDGKRLRACDIPLAMRSVGSFGTLWLADSVAGSGNLARIVIFFAGERPSSMWRSLPSHRIVWLAQGSRSATGYGGRARSRVDGVERGRRYVAHDGAGSRCRPCGTGSGGGGRYGYAPVTSVSALRGRVGSAGRA
jgi:hypothetical protein